MVRSEAPVGQQRVVIARSGNRCAYPDCGIDLVEDPGAAGDRPKATGKVAHIAAASDGGPRFDPEMTDAERGSAANLIYLCGSHHDVIDSQLELHTRDFLQNAKQTHEEAVARAVRAALGEVTYAELELVCTVISQPQTSAPGEVELALPVQEKIELNDLSPVSAEKIRDGLAQASRVAGFVEFQGKHDSAFGQRLADRFKSDYYGARADGLTGDEIFDVLVDAAQENAGPRDSPAVRAAALAVISYLFEMCEVFEHA